MFTACGIKHRRCSLLVTSRQDGRNYHPKHVELIEIVNKIIIVASSRLFILLYLPIHCVSKRTDTIIRL